MVIKTFKIIIKKNYNNKQHQHKFETKSALCKCLLNERKQWRLESENSVLNKNY